MEILFLCHRIPYPPNKGDKIRSHALLVHLAKRHRVHVGCFVDDPSDMKYCATVRAIAGGECAFVPLSRLHKWVGAAKAVSTCEPITISSLHSGILRSWVNEQLRTRQIGAAVVFSSGMVPYVLQQSVLPASHAILDMVDIDSDKWRQYSELTSGAQKWLFRREAKLLERVERSAARQFAATVFVSEYEARSFAEIAPESRSRIVAIPNGVDLSRFAPGEFPNPFGADEVPVVMTGRMDYRPNVDGVNWFAREVLPLVKKQLPAVRFHAVGAYPPHSWSSESSSIVVADSVPDVRPYIQHAAAVVAPLRIARGIQNKVLEAMAMEKPVVATIEATRALGVTAGKDILVENDPMRFANAVVTAVGNVSLGQSARQYVQQHHDWNHNLEPLDYHLARIEATNRDDSHGIALRSASANRALPESVRDAAE